jgi:hypothetical protein
MLTLKIFLLTITVALTLCAGEDTFIGTWKLDAENSRTSTGRIPLGRVSRYEAIEGGLKITFIDSIDGRNRTEQTTAIFDAREHSAPASLMARYAGAEVFVSERVSPRVFVTTLKKGGKTVGTAWRYVSQDGKTLTVVLSLVSDLVEPTYSAFTYRRE